MLNVFWTKVASKRRIKQLDFFDWLSNVKNLVLSNGSEHLQNVVAVPASSSGDVETSMEATTNER